MLVFAKKPIVTAVSFMLFTFLLLSYQNCAKPLEEIGMNASMSGTGSCQISVSKPQVVLNENQAIAFTYSPAALKIRIVVMNNSSGVFTESVYSVSGVLDVTYTVAAQAGSYTVHGVVETEDGATAGTCTTTFSVKGPPATGGPNPPSVATFAWSAGAWSACSASACGTSGTQIRAVSCNRNDGAVVADSFCSGAGAKPASSQACSAAACSATYSWLIGSWSACSVTACGQTGTQSRSVVCRDNSNVTVADSFCGAKPAISQSCSTPSCEPRDPPGCKTGDTNCHIQ